MGATIASCLRNVLPRTPSLLPVARDVGGTILYLYGRFIPRGLAAEVILRRPSPRRPCKPRRLYNDAPTLSHNSHNSHKSHNSQPCVAPLCTHTTAVIKQCDLSGRFFTRGLFAGGFRSPLHPGARRGRERQILRRYAGGGGQ